MTQIFMGANGVYTDTLGIKFADGTTQTTAGGGSTVYYVLTDIDCGLFGGVVVLELDGGMY